MSLVLVVDDDHLIRKLYAEELGDVGYHMAFCGDMSCLVNVIAQVRPDVVVMEIHSGNRDRWDLLRTIRKMYPGLPVILNTAAIILPVESNGLADAHVPKSYDLSALKTKIKALIEGSPPIPWDRSQPLLLPHQTPAHEFKVLQQNLWVAFG